VSYNCHRKYPLRHNIVTANSHRQFLVISDGRAIAPHLPRENAVLFISGWEICVSAYLQRNIGKWILAATVDMRSAPLDSRGADRLEFFLKDTLDGGSGYGTDFSSEGADPFQGSHG
jgi:hypothetical protein